VGDVRRVEVSAHNLGGVLRCGFRSSRVSARRGRASNKRAEPCQRATGAL
jgi:hypothetical protein